MKYISMLLIIGILWSCDRKHEIFELLPSEKTGITFVNEITESDSFNILTNEYMYNGGGVGIGDLNNDGLQDIVFTGNLVSTEIYLNQGNFTFKNITSSLDGLSARKWHSGIAIADINGDGWTDIYLTSTTSPDPYQRQNECWINQGTDAGGIPRFKEEASKMGINDTGFSVHAGFFDYDLDGDLDLYIINNIVKRQVPTNYRPKIVDGTAINNDRLYQNVGDGIYKNVSVEAGITIEGYGLGLAFGDINLDGYPDIYVSNDYVSNDILYINQQDGTFQNEADQLLSYQSKFSMGNDISDVNQDGYPDIFTLDMMPEQYSRKKQTINGNSYQFYINDDRYHYQHQYVRNMLHLHNGLHKGKPITYSEIGQLSGLYQTEWSWSALFADYDNDGDKDVMITNGFPKDLTDKDFTNYKAQFYGYVATAQQVISKIPVVKVSNYAFENQGNLTFENATQKWGIEIPSFSNGAAFSDLDHDGDLDYIVNNINDPAFIYQNHNQQNTSPSNYLRLSLTGNAPNTPAIGAKVEIWKGNHYQYYEHFLTRGYISSVEPVIHFGLGEIQFLDSLRVIWPSGKRKTVIKNIPVNQTLNLKESKSHTNAHSIRTGTPQSYLFEEITGHIDYTHQQEDYIDFFQNQPILQHKLSQIGPFMDPGDIDGNGAADLIIGAHNTQPIQVYLQNEGSFTRTEFSGLTDSLVTTHSDIKLVDVDNDGDLDVIALAGGYEKKNNTEYIHKLYRNQGDRFKEEMLPIPAFPASVLALCDFDKDGDLDLFVGARVQRGNYPDAPLSYVLINEQGNFSEASTLSYDLGMVTDAAWSDVNGDDWEDLILTREWNSLIILQNETGKSLSPFLPEEIGNVHGMWMEIEAADLDQDGDDDYIVGNLGINHRFNISQKYPLNLYAVDIDQNGTIDPICSGYWRNDKGEMTEYPVNYLDELASQSPFFRKLFTSYTEFSKMDMPSILAESNLDIAPPQYINETRSYILWNENGSFTWEELPLKLQFSPINAILIKDLNQDGFEDVILAGNDHSFDVSTGNYDANRGYVMLGGSERSFNLLEPSESGMILTGQVASLVYMEGDYPLLLVGINRDTLRVYKILDLIQ